MGRRPRRDPEGGIHHVMNRGVDHQPIFLADADRVEFGRRLADIHGRHGIQTLAYCLMTNHYHLILQAPSGGLSAAMHHLSSVYTRHTNDRVGRDGPLFRGRFLSIPITNDPYLLWATRYVHRNPLDLPGVLGIDRYRWSSYRAYLGHRRPAAFLNVAMVLGRFGGDPHALASFTEGADGWLEADRAADASKTEAEQLASIVDFAVAHDQMTQGVDDARPQWLSRAVLVLLSERASDAHTREAARRLLQQATASARRAALRRANQRMTIDPAVGRVLDAVQRHHARSPDQACSECA